MSAAVLGLFFVPKGIASESAIGVRDRVAESAMLAQARHSESTMRDSDTTAVECDHRGQPRRVRDQGTRVRGLGAVMAANNSLMDQRKSTPPPATRSICILPDCEHAPRFVAWLIHDEDGDAHTVTLSDGSLMGHYVVWCERHKVQPLPYKTMLTQVGRLPQVEKDRPIKKCPETGRALYLETGSPDRWTRYTIRPPQKLPGKVPVGDVVQPRKLDPPRQRRPPEVAQPAAPSVPAPEQPDPFEQPLPRAA